MNAAIAHFPSTLYATDEFGVYLAVRPEAFEIERQNFIAAANCHYPEVQPNWVPNYQTWELIDPSAGLYECSEYRVARRATAEWSEAESVYKMVDAN